MAITNLVPWKWGEKKVPVRRQEERPFYTLGQDMNRLFDDFFSGGFGMAPFGESFGAFSPNVDVTENDKEITVLNKILWRTLSVTFASMKNKNKDNV